MSATPGCVAFAGPEKGRSKRIEVDLEKLNFHVMRDLFAAGDDYLPEIEKLKSQGKVATSSEPARKARKVAKAQSLRERDPW